MGLSAILIKSSRVFFCRYREGHLKIYMERQWNQNSQDMSKKEVIGLTLTLRLTYHKVRVTKTAWYWHREKDTDQQSTIEFKIDPQKYGWLIFFFTEVESQLSEERIVFPTSSVWKLDIYMQKQKWFHTC